MTACAEKAQTAEVAAVTELDSSAEPGPEYQCRAQASAFPSGGSPADQGLYAATPAIWPKGRREIPVCWEPDTYALRTDADRAIVRRAVAETWELALDFDAVPEADRVRFTGWDECRSSEEGGVRIAVPLDPSEGPGVEQLGSRLDGLRAGVTLDFDFTSWGQVCRASEGQRQFCIYAIAVHEFGHVLGFSHEHNRPDTDRAACTDAPQGAYGNLLLGPWDRQSVMNYCNDDWNNGGALSDGDVLGVRAAYYPELYDFTCVGELKARWAEERDLSAD